MIASVSFSAVGMTVSTPVVTATPPLDLRRRVGDGVTSLEANSVWLYRWLLTRRAEDVDLLSESEKMYVCTVC